MRAQTARLLRQYRVLIALVIGPILGFWVLGTMIGNSRGTASPTPTPAPSTGEAHLICQDFVLKRLLAPSTAKFPKLGDVKAFREAGHMTVIGYVDSQNGFGAQIRTPYTCSVEPLGEERWRLVALDL